MPSIGVALFRIFYRFSYSLLLLILLVLIAVTPGDHIYQTISNGKLGNVFVVAAVYFVTASVALFIYASRLYTNRTALAAIPRVYIPIEKGEVSRNVRRMIVKSRLRSALVAWDSHPRDTRAELQIESEIANTEKPEQSKAGAKRKAPQNDFVIPIAPGSPPWGDVVHPGSSSPTADDLPNIQYATVVAEFPNLIEAKAVSMAPPDSTYDFMAEFQDALPPPPDPHAVALLQRPANMGLREYLGHLDELGVVDPSEVSIPFLALYEYARFSTDFLTDAEFRDLTTAFSNVLASIVPFDPSAVSEAAKSSGTQTPNSVKRNSMKNFRLRPESLVGRNSEASSLHSSESVVHHDVGSYDVNPP